MVHESGAGHGYPLLLEEAPKSIAPVRVREPFFEIDPVFAGASYKQRYEIFCRRLILERLATFMAAIRSRAAYLFAAGKG